MKKIAEMNMNQKYFVVSIVTQMADYVELLDRGSKGYEFLNAVKNYNVGTKYIIMYNDTVYFYDEIIEIETLVEDIMVPLQKYVEENDLHRDSLIQQIFSTFEKNVEELEDGTEVWVGMPDSDIFDYSLNVVGELATPYDELPYVEAYGVRNVGTDDERLYIFVTEQPDENMVGEMKSALADFKHRLETDVRVNRIIHIWEDMEIENPYDPFLDFTRYLYHSHLDNEDDYDEYIKYLNLYKFCKELIASKMVPSLHPRMRKTVFIEGDTITAYDRASSVGCNLAELYGAFCDYDNERDVEDDHLSCVYKLASIAGVNMLLRISPTTQSDLVRIPDGCNMGYDVIAQAIYDGRNPTYVPDDPTDEDSNRHPVYKNPNNIIPQFWD